MSAAEFKEQGNAKYKDGKYTEAVKLYSKAIELESDNAALYSNRSVAYLLLEKHDEALADANKCCELKPDWEKGHFRKAAALEAMGSLAEALPEYQTARDLNPQNLEISGKVQELRKRLKQEQKKLAKTEKKALAAASADNDTGGGRVHSFQLSPGGGLTGGQIHQVSHPPGRPEPADWAKGLSPAKQAEWLVDCYRMRVDDDYAWGGGDLHGLYDPECSKDSICEDFLIFCKLAVQHNVIPPSWNWQKFLSTASGLLPYAFEKEDAKEKWGGENVFQAMLGGRSLRFTGEVVYGSSIMGRGARGMATEEDSRSDNDFDELSEKVVGNWDDLVAGESDTFADVGGVSVWRDLHRKLRLVRPAYGY